MSEIIVDELSDVAEELIPVAVDAALDITTTSIGKKLAYAVGIGVGGGILVFAVVKGVKVLVKKHKEKSAKHLEEPAEVIEPAEDTTESK